MEERPWAHYLGTLSHAEAIGAIHETDVVLNNSVAEGLPNALIEAAALGRPILARDNDGNREIVEHGVNGLLYRREAVFIEAAGRLIDDPSLRRSLGRPEPERFAPRREAARLEELLLRAVRQAATKDPA